MTLAQNTMGGFSMTLDTQVFQAPRTDHDAGRSGKHASPGRRRPERPVRFPLPSIAILIFSLAAAACATTPPAPHPWVVRDGMTQVETYGRGLLYVKPDHHLGRYDDLVVERVGFRYGPDQKRLADLDEDRIVTMLVDAIPESQDGVIGLKTVPGPCVLSVNFFLKDLEFTEPDWKADSTTSYVASYGEATMILELRDSMSHEPLARFVQKRDLGGGRTVASRGTNLGRLRQAITEAMRDMGNQLRKLAPPSAGGGTPDSECEGGVARVVLGAR
jgi:hypothetical protein